jgi:tetratricopeptide (TPR) repeat protein
LNSIFTITKTTKKLVFALTLIAITSISITYIYYSSKNKAEDPRIVESRKNLARLDRLMSEKEYDKVLKLLNQIQANYTQIPYYRKSYEQGVVHNNRGSVYLQQALYECKDSIIKLQLLENAENEFIHSIHYYKNWLKKFSDMKEDEIHEYVHQNLFRDNTDLSQKTLAKILKKKTEDEVFAKIENLRRLSVTYSNMGIIKRHQMKQDSALEYFAKALCLWDKNHVAKNNMNVLLGRPIEKKGVLEKLFPPDRYKE